MRSLSRLPFHLCLLLASMPEGPGALATEHKPAPSPRVYTNDDLERISAWRGQTGVDSKPAVAAEASHSARRRSPSAPETAAAARLERERAQRTAAERYWRGQAEALRRRLLPLHQRLDELSASLTRTREAAERASRRPRRSAARAASADKARSIEERIAALEDRIRSEQALLAERARRAGALPGWLR
jgi:hypothetical protein